MLWQVREYRSDSKLLMNTESTKVPERRICFAQCCDGHRRFADRTLPGSQDFCPHRSWVRRRSVDRGHRRRSCRQPKKICVACRNPALDVAYVCGTRNTPAGSGFDLVTTPTSPRRNVMKRTTFLHATTLTVLAFLTLTVCTESKATPIEWRYD